MNLAATKSKTLEDPGFADAAAGGVWERPLARGVRAEPDGGEHVASVINTPSSPVSLENAAGIVTLVETHLPTWSSICVKRPWKARPRGARGRAARMDGSSHSRAPAARP